MSVQQESLEAQKRAPRVEEPPELAYTAVRNESLAMFGAAAGGAVVGMMLTLLVLAIINGGTLSFSGGERLDILEANVARINDNVGAVSHNVDVIAQQAAALEQELGTTEAALQTELASQAGDIASLNQAIDTLDMTRQRLDLFVGAMQKAVADMAALGDEGAVAEPAAAAATQTATVVLFVDDNGNGTYDSGEQVVSGAQVSVVDASGNSQAEALSAEEGAVVRGLAPGEYALSVSDLEGYKLATEGPVSFTVDEGSDQTLYLPVVAESN